MDVRFLPDKNGMKRMTTEELRSSFLIDELFIKNKIPMTYSDVERSITGSAVPTTKALKLTATKKEMAAEYFTERREIGIINIGEAGTIKVNNKVYNMGSKDGLYIGRGKKTIEFKSKNAKKPAMFYFVSYPAHTEYPDVHVKYENAIKRELGSLTDANKRRINQYFHPDIMPTCQLVMGLTELEDGSVWNTMPAHTHQRRSEVYMYFNMKPDAFVVHLLGEPTETRHIIIRNNQAVLSTSWSMHSGAGTRNYSFIWAMGGENQVYDDMDWIAMQDLK